MDPFLKGILSGTLGALIALVIKAAFFPQEDTCTVCPICNPEVKETYLEQQWEDNHKDDPLSAEDLWYSLGYGNRDE